MIKIEEVNGHKVVQIPQDTTVVCGECGQRIKYIYFHDLHKHKPTCDMLK